MEYNPFKEISKIEKKKEKAVLNPEEENDDEVFD